MCDDVHDKLARNLRRWLAAGGPDAWVDSRGGRWDEAELREFLFALSWSDYWPMEPDAVRAALEQARAGWGFHRWQASGQARRWVAERAGEWLHDDWLALLEALRHSEFWPLDEGAVGAALERARVERHNLRRWEASGQPRLWVEARQGHWTHVDWLALVADLRRSEFWPLDLDAIGAVLEGLKQAHHNLLRWQLSGQARQWVEARRGQWDGAAWHELTESLRQSEFWPLEPIGVARVLEGFKQEWWNLHRWRTSGLARRWVEAREGRWDHDDWLALLASLRAGGFWPVDPAALGRLLEDVRGEWQNLRRWAQSGGPRRWAEAHPGGWGRDELAALLDELSRSEFWPLDAAAVAGLLGEVRAGSENLRRWRASDQPRYWVEAHGGAWAHGDWLALLDELRASAFWPMPPEEIGRVLEEARGDAAVVLALPGRGARAADRRAA
jgi:hypothetical protein